PGAGRRPPGTVADEVHRPDPEYERKDSAEGDHGPFGPPARAIEPRELLLDRGLKVAALDLLLACVPQQLEIGPEVGTATGPCVLAVVDTPSGTKHTRDRSEDRVGVEADLTGIEGHRSPLSLANDAPKNSSLAYETTRKPPIFRREGAPRSPAAAPSYFPDSP